MSPECAKGEAYGFSTDVHSFAILLWEILALETAFQKAHTVQQLSQMAFVGHRRPPLGKIRARDTRRLLRACWDPRPELRPSFAPIVAQLSSSSSPRGPTSKGNKKKGVDKMTMR